jgi:hypothetical protein
MYVCQTTYVKEGMSSLCERARSRLPSLSETEHRKIIKYVLILCYSQLINNWYINQQMHLIKYNVRRVIISIFRNQGAILRKSFITEEYKPNPLTWVLNRPHWNDWYSKINKMEKHKITKLWHSVYMTAAAVPVRSYLYSACSMYTNICVLNSVWVRVA